MKVKDLRKFLEECEDDDVVVIRSDSFTWECYHGVKNLERTVLQNSGGLYQEEKYDGEPEFPIQVIIIR